jgi:hypothetical protein
MVTMLEEYAIEEQLSVMRFSCVRKRINANNIHNEMFPIYGEKCVSRIANHNWLANLSLMKKRFKWRCGSG